MEHGLNCAPPEGWGGNRPRGRITILIIVLVFAGWLIRQGNNLDSVVTAITAITSAAAGLITLMAHGRNADEPPLGGGAATLGQGR